MGLDNHTVVIYGWKVDGNEKVEEFENKLDEAYEDWWDEFIDEYFIADSMMGNYIYFGAILADYDVEWDDDPEVIITDELSKSATAKYNKFISEHPEISKVFDEYKEGEPQLYVFQHIW